MDGVGHSLSTVLGPAASASVPLGESWGSKGPSHLPPLGSSGPLGHACKLPAVVCSSCRHALALHVQCCGWQLPFYRLTCSRSLASVSFCYQLTINWLLLAARTLLDGRCCLSSPLALPNFTLAHRLFWFHVVACPCIVQVTLLLQCVTSPPMHLAFNSSLHLAVRKLLHVS